MKLMAIFAMLLFIGAIIPVNATLTAQDIAWGKATWPVTDILADDCKLVSAAIDANDISMMQMACNTTKEDIISAELVNHAMPVSQEMQIIKDDYTSVLTCMWLGMEDIRAGYTSGNLTKFKLGTSEISQSNVYSRKMIRDMDVIAEAMKQAQGGKENQ